MANNSRFLILPESHVPNLASRLMKLCLQRLSQDWQEYYGHEVLLAESFVDRQRCLGTCYKASGWTRLGQTQGFARSRQDFYEAHDRPKELWVRQPRAGDTTMSVTVRQPCEPAPSGVGRSGRILAEELSP